MTDHQAKVFTLNNEMACIRRATSGLQRRGHIVLSVNPSKYEKGRVDIDLASPLGVCYTVCAVDLKNVAL